MEHSIKPNSSNLNHLSLFERVHLNETISTQAVKLVKTYVKSHRLDIPESIIASTALVHLTCCQKLNHLQS